MSKASRFDIKVRAMMRQLVREVELKSVETKDGKELLKPALPIAHKIIEKIEGRDKP
jgi:hypothetical protein